jgi:hypothetical protein
LLFGCELPRVRFRLCVSTSQHASVRNAGAS